MASKWNTGVTVWVEMISAKKMLVFACDRRFFPGETRSRRNRGTAGGRADDKIFGCQQQDANSKDQSVS